MSTMISLCSELMMSNSGNDNNEAYLEIVLDIFEDSVAIHSVEGEAILEDPEFSSLAKKTLENRSSSTSSSVGFSLLGNTCSQINQLKHKIASLTKRPSAFRRFDQSKSAAAQALKRL
ncbi:hypothetical protein Patl1_05621 [Pistacia atlantica]|uniref:Uncharacterized protein n=1 Tax=Pistacia atlantica TaxID=434234 RepID=A0ACC1BTV5_9ROSI|nr:hypothetical protein Patl1_05621 [Pistacia atlantica]